MTQQDQTNKQVFKAFFARLSGTVRLEILVAKMFDEGAIAKDHPEASANLSILASLLAERLSLHMMSTVDVWGEDIDRKTLFNLVTQLHLEEIVEIFGPNFARYCHEIFKNELNHSQGEVFNAVEAVQRVGLYSPSHSKLSPSDLVVAHKMFVAGLPVKMEAYSSSLGRLIV